MGAESHLVRGSQAQLDKVEIKLGRQRLAVPAIEFEVLEVIAFRRGGLVPVREERGGEVDPLAIRSVTCSPARQSLHDGLARRDQRCRRGAPTHRSRC